MAGDGHDTGSTAVDEDHNAPDRGGGVEGDASGVQPHKRSTLTDKQRNHIERLMLNIDKSIELPASTKPTLKPPPEIVLNVRGSSAGAGSSDFSIYRDLRRKENARMKFMEAEAAEDIAKERFADEAESLKRKDDERTAKNRAKRQRRNAKGKGKAAVS